MLRKCDQNIMAVFFFLFFFCFALYGASHRYNFENASFLLNILLLPSVSYSNDMSQKLYTLGINMCYTGTIHLRYTVLQLELTHR